MKLISLDANSESFRRIVFRTGLTLIVGDSPKDNGDGTSNGVGKTMAMGLVHHCLGATPDKRLMRAVPEWNFRLRFAMAGREHEIVRSGDGKIIKWDGTRFTLAALRRNLSEVGPFNIPADAPWLTFRSLFGRFARYQREDCVDPIKTYREEAHEALIRTMFLLGLDVYLAVEKAKLKQDIDELDRRAKLFASNEPFFVELTRAGGKPQVREAMLRDKIARLQKDLSDVHIAADYRELEQTADALTSRLRNISTDTHALNFQIASIEKSLTEKPGLSKEQLLAFYQGLVQLFKPEALQHLEAVESFHKTLTSNRLARLTRERLRLIAAKDSLEREQHAIESERDLLLSRLKGSTTLEEYSSLMRQLARYEEELAGLMHYLGLSESIGKSKQALREQLVKSDAKAAKYLETAPIAAADRAFRYAAQKLYPGYDAGVVLEANNRTNKLRYDLSVVLQGDGSDGINAAKVLCFDWLILTGGAHHTMEFVWHDNRLFADIDPQQRAKWFQHLLVQLPQTGKSYIASLNEENLEAMRPHLSNVEWQALESAVVLRLKGDRPANKLMGIQFEGS